MKEFIPDRMNRLEMEKTYKKAKSKTKMGPLRFELRIPAV